ncbi:transcriptional regulator, partial [Morganella morganii]
CVESGLCVAMMPAHRADPLIEKGRLAALKIEQPLPDSPCCITWVDKDTSPALSWLLDYLGDSSTLNAEWLR